MSFVEGPKSGLAGLSIQIPGISPHSSHNLQPGCVQCGSLLDVLDARKRNFSGKCFTCENWIFDEDEEYEELDD